VSRLAALAMRDLADCLDEEAERLPPHLFKAGVRELMSAMARAHRVAADRIEARVEKPEVPPEYRAGQAGSRKGDR
jgi:hypothetical protein